MYGTFIALSGQFCLSEMTSVHGHMSYDIAEDNLTGLCNCLTIHRIENVDSPSNINNKKP